MGFFIYILIYIFYLIILIKNDQQLTFLYTWIMNAHSKLFKPFCQPFIFVFINKTFINPDSINNGVKPLLLP